MATNKQIAENVLKAVGGKENVVNLPDYACIRGDIEDVISCDKLWGGANDL